MFDRVIRRRLTLCFTLALLLVTVAGSTLRAAAPTAPSNLTAVVNGLNVSFTWVASANNPMQYELQAGMTPGATSIRAPISGAATSFAASGNPGTYYVRLVAINADGTSAPSNEVTVVLTSSCAAPSAPLNLRAIIRGTEAYVFWRQPQFGSVSSYLLQVGAAPGQTFTQFSTSRTTLNASVANGTYFLRVVAFGPCGSSAASNEIQISFPSNTVRVADPDPGTTLGLPDIERLVASINETSPGLIAQSCPTGRKYEPNPWLNYIVDVLRQFDTRFGYNGKPTKTPADNGGAPVIAAGDEVTFFAGSGTAEGSRTVYAIDVLFGHCGPNPSVTYRDFTGQEEAFWTGAGRFSGDPRQ